MIKNMPGLLNLLAQQYSSLDSGTRYAATAIFRYLITVIGIVIGLSFLQINWGQYSWLVAAVTVGLGFGLQEIVANFVSGLILLFERPVRVGDLVTIDDTTGVVTRIQMRATTVTNWDNQELVVPNKALVTGKLLNWTLSSLTTRLVLQVSVAYRSDPQIVQQMLIDVVSRHPDVMKDPPVSVTLESFGESALEFTIRCFLPSVDKRVPARHELNTAIFSALKAAKIDIPFPQREIHMVERHP
jgi:potassium efflux system protein